MMSARTSPRNITLQEVHMIRSHFRTLALVVALGATAAVGAQTTSSPSGSGTTATNPAEVISPPPRAGTAATTNDRLPATRKDDATHACASLTGAAQEQCLAKENARTSTGKSHSGTGMGSPTGTTSEQNPSAGNDTSGSMSGYGSPTNTPKGK
jgi:hypothetical protein